MHHFTTREMNIISYLKTHTINQTAEKFGVPRHSIDKTLYRIRNKIEWADGTFHLAAVWKDGKRNPRLAKLLRRQEPTEEDEGP